MNVVILEENGPIVLKNCISKPECLVYDEFQYQFVGIMSIVDTALTNSQFDFKIFTFRETL